MDLGLSRDWMDSLIIYQRRIRREFQKLSETYDFRAINANRSVNAIQGELRACMTQVLASTTRPKRPTYATNQRRTEGSPAFGSTRTPRGSQQPQRGSAAKAKKTA